jgi:YD repeat-containing protein
MSTFSRRGFLAGLLGVLAGWLGARQKPVKAASAPVTPPVGERMVEYSTTLESITTCTYDARGRRVAMTHYDASLGSVTTYCYDGQSGQR